MKREYARAIALLFLLVSITGQAYSSPDSNNVSPSGEANVQGSPQSNPGSVHDSALSPVRVAPSINDPTIVIEVSISKPVTEGVLKLIVPGRETTPRGRNGELKTLSSHVSALGYPVADATDRDLACVTAVLDGRMRGFAAKGGGRVILVANTTPSVPALVFSDLIVAKREATTVWGDWSQSIVSLRNSGPVRTVVLGQDMGFPFSDVFAGTAITGFDSRRDTEDESSGPRIGWLCRPVALAAQFDAGSGRVFVTSCDLMPLFGVDPTVTALLRSAISYVSDKDVTPSTQADLSQGVSAAN